MFKLLATLLLLSSLLFANNLKEYRIFANQVEVQGDYVYALGDVVVYSDDYVLNADRVVFNKKKEEVELFGNVHILGFDDKAINSKYMRVNLKTKKLSASPFFFFDPETYVWIKSFEAKTETNKYKIDHAIVSSCDVKNPDWKITFSKGDYDKNSSMVTIKNAVFYAGKVPLFYLPYFKFPTDKSRHSGLLRPSGGYEKVEGIYYRQPIYIVIDKSKDIEIDPQIRTERGRGLYATLRFADSLYSRGFVRVGAFWERYGYYDKYDLKNKSHRGFEIGYERSKLFSDYFKEDTKDGLLVDITYLNDIDYLNLQESNKKKIFNKLVTSKINYFLDRGEDFVGVYAKYFIDTEKVSNDDTLQTLPSVQYHRVIQPVLFSNLLYSSDFKFKNWYRKEGISAKQYELSLPIILYFSFFDDYLNFSASENLYFTYVDYDNSESQISNGTYFSNYHKFSLNTDLLKRYEAFIHNLNMNLDFIVPSVENRKGDFEDFIALNKEKKSLNLSISQFFYDNKAFNFFLHRIRQSYFFDKDIYKYGDLENEVRYRLSKDLEFYNQLFYSYEKHKLRKSQTTVTYNRKDLDLKLIHNYEKARSEKSEDSNFFIAKVKTKLSKRYDIFANIDYDMKNNFTREWKIGWIFKKKCWNYKIAYRQSVTPSLTSEGTESITKKGVFLILNLVPIGGIHYEFTKSSNFSEDR